MSGWPALSSANNTWFGTFWNVARPVAAGLLTGRPDRPGTGAGPENGATVDREIETNAIPKITTTAISEEMISARNLAGLDTARCMLRALPFCGLLPDGGLAAAGVQRHPRRRTLLSCLIHHPTNSLPQATRVTQGPANDSQANPSKSPLCRGIPWRYTALHGRLPPGS